MKCLREAMTFDDQLARMKKVYVDDYANEFSAITISGNGSAEDTASEAET